MAMRAPRRPQPKLKIFLPFAFSTADSVFNQHEAIEKFFKTNNLPKKSYQKLLHKFESGYIRERTKIIKLINDWNAKFKASVKEEKNGDAVILESQDDLSLVDEILWEKMIPYYAGEYRRRIEVRKNIKETGYAFQDLHNRDIGERNYYRGSLFSYSPYSQYKLAPSLIKRELLYNPCFADKEFLKSMTMMSLLSLEGIIAAAHGFEIGDEKEKLDYGHVKLRMVEKLLHSLGINGINLLGELKKIDTILGRTNNYYEFNDEVRIHPGAFDLSSEIRDLDPEVTVVVIGFEEVGVFQRKEEDFLNSKNWSIKRIDSHSILEEDEDQRNRMASLLSCFGDLEDDYYELTYVPLDPQFGMPRPILRKHGLTATEANRIGLEKCEREEIIKVPKQMRFASWGHNFLAEIHRSHEVNNLLAREILATKLGIEDLTVKGHREGKYYDFNADVGEGPIVYFAADGYVMLERNQLGEFLSKNFKITGDTHGKFAVPEGIRILPEFQKMDLRDAFYWSSPEEKSQFKL